LEGIWGKGGAFQAHSLVVPDAAQEQHAIRI